ncbi:bifunctional purple acid phosphatase 26-like isoform X2 [Cornus florida]|uniref:bifunctional purple acid phosphatase 26-like isoform X2 n=1 Tax=Cornus florida TaxID=4283 RepID=UPI0028A06265|nr:bifunctional purple acid phosphatase 26-like isoform X2 [Cornus florida]
MLWAYAQRLTSFRFLYILFVASSSVEHGSARITSTFIRSEWPSIDVPLDNEVFKVPKGYNAPQQVHIIQGDYDGKAVIISWVTTDEPGSSKVQYGTSQKKYDFSADGTMTNYTFYKYKSGYIHHCLVDGLQHYMQTGGQTVLFVGDLSYADRYKYNDVGIRWDSWSRFIEQSAAYQPWIWSAGNHEIEYMPNMGEVFPFKSYLHRFATPHLASGSSNPLWYSVRRASAHIIVLSSYSPYVKSTPQWKWLREELKKVDREKTPWLIVLMHAPIYSSNVAHYMEGESMRAVFESWFVRSRVDLIFAGHVHAYERSYRISNIHYNVSSGERYPIPDKSAPVYITVGDGGNQEGLAGRFYDPQPEYSAFREASYGHSTLEIMNRTHAFYHWNRNNDGRKVATDSVVFRNQYWASNLRRRRLKKIL